MHNKTWTKHSVSSACELVQKVETDVADSGAQSGSVSDS